MVVLPVDPARWRRTAGYIAWRMAVLALLTLAAAWDVLGLIVGGDSAYTSPSYDLLRQISPWGMRGWGVILGVLLAAAVYAYGRHAGAGTTARTYTMLRGCLAGLAAWYMLWAVGICGGWWIHGQILAWGSVGKLLFVAVIAVLLARTTPTMIPHGTQGR